MGAGSATNISRIGNDNLLVIDLLDDVLDGLMKENKNIKELKNLFANHEEVIKLKVSNTTDKWKDSSEFTVFIKHLVESMKFKCTEDDIEKFVEGSYNGIIFYLNIKNVDLQTEREIYDKLLNNFMNDKSKSISLASDNRDHIITEKDIIAFQHYETNEWLCSSQDTRNYAYFPCTDSLENRDSYMLEFENATGVKHFENKSEVRLHCTTNPYIQHGSKEVKYLYQTYHGSGCWYQKETIGDIAYKQKWIIRKRDGALRDGDLIILESKYAIREKCAFKALGRWEGEDQTARIEAENLVGVLMNTVTKHTAPKRFYSSIWRVKALSCHSKAIYWHVRVVIDVITENVQAISKSSNESFAAKALKNFSSNTFKIGLEVGGNVS